MIRRINIKSLALIAVVGIGVLLLAARAGVACSSVCDGYVDSRLKDPKEIVQDGRLLGLDNEGLYEAIGEPADGWHFDGWDQAYYIGSDDSCVDSKWLVVKLGPDGRVVRVGITND
ncbi:MAG: hypothetical protein AB7N24_02785 [Dehalococcoidia bacterium]